MHVPERLLFSQQQLCNKVRAQEEKQINTEAAGSRYACDQRCKGYISSRIIICLVWQGMENKHCEEGEETQAIQLGVIEAALWRGCSALGRLYTRLRHLIPNSL